MASQKPIVVNGLVIEPPESKRAAGDELAARALARWRADPRGELRDAIRAELRRDAYLAGRYGVEGK